MGDLMDTAQEQASGHFGRPAALLSPRERESLQLMARGFSYAEMARLQQISVNTTRSHMKSVFAKLDVHSKTEAVYEATVMGLLEPAGRTAVRHSAYLGVSAA